MKNQPILDPTIDEIRAVRRQISVKCDNDPERLVEYYIQFQTQFRDRLVNEAETDKSAPSSAA